MPEHTCQARLTAVVATDAKLEATVDMVVRMTAFDRSDGNLVVTRLQRQPGDVEVHEPLAGQHRYRCRPVLRVWPGQGHTRLMPEPQTEDDVAQRPSECTTAPRNRCATSSSVWGSG